MLSNMAHNYPTEQHCFKIPVANSQCAKQTVCLHNDKNHISYMSIPFLMFLAGDVAFTDTWAFHPLSDSFQSLKNLHLALKT